MQAQRWPFSRRPSLNERQYCVLHVLPKNTAHERWSRSQLVVRSLFAYLSLLAAAPFAAATPREVVVELTTPEGRLSSPATDAYLLELGQRRSDVFPLAFHVTYWNGLGWKDPVSHDFARHQSEYDWRFHDEV